MPKPSDGQSDGEATFVFFFRILCRGCPMYTREYEFDEGRRWRSDFCWPALKVCVEVEGADHRRYDRFKGDIQKYEALRAAGWELMRVTMGEMERDPDKWFGALKSALARRHRSDG